MNRSLSRSSLAAGVAVTILLLVAAALFGELVSNPTAALVGKHRQGQNDLVAFCSTWLPAQATYRETGRWPRWNDDVLAGRPITGNPQAALWYPPNWLIVAWPYPATFGWIMIGHHAWLGLGTVLWARRLGLRRGADLVAGAFALGAPYFVSHTSEGHFPQIEVASWIPWTFWACDIFLHRPGKGWPLLSGAIALALLAGHPQEAFYTAILLIPGVVAVVWRSSRRGRGNRVVAIALAGCLAALTAIGLVAIDVLPVSLYSANSVRSSGISAAAAAAQSPRLDQLPQLWNPFALGTPDEVLQANRFYWESLLYFGVIPLGLTLLGVATAMGRRRWTNVAMLWVIALLFATGEATPLFPMLHEYVPGFSLFRNPSRILFHVSVLGAALAGLGCATICHALRAKSVPVATGIAMVLGVLGVAELSWFAWQVLAVVPGAVVRAEHPLAEWLLERQGDRRVLITQNLLNDAEAGLFGVSKLQGYEPVPLVTQARLFAALTDHDPPEALLGYNPLDADQLDPVVLRAAGVEWLVTPPRKVPPESPHWTQIAKGTVPRLPGTGRQPAGQLAYEIYRFANPLPRAYVVGGAKVFNPSRTLTEQLRELEADREVLLSRDILPDGPRAEFGGATIHQKFPDEFVVEVATQHPGYLVVRDTDARGWSAMLNGKQIPLLNANGSFRAVPLSAGTHRVAFSFEPPGLAMGRQVTLLSLAVLVLGGCWSLRRNALPASRRATTVELPPAE